MLGFAPVTPSAAAAVEPSLSEVNSRLGAYKQAWDSAVDAWLVIKIGDPQVGAWVLGFGFWVWVWVWGLEGGVPVGGC